MKNIINLLILACITVSCLCQQQTFINDYELSVCKGKIPSEFNKNILDKTKEDVVNDDFDLSNSKKETFYENSNYYIYKFLNGGKVLFGDEMSVYVNEVATALLDKSGNAELKDKLKFYVLKSNVVNAVCMPDGSIFITVGLLSQIENEAQLAFVLAHEISHYILKHGIKTYSNNEKMRTNYNRSKIGYDDAIVDLSEYSKDQELESDDAGYAMYLEAGYSSDEAIKMLLVLQYSHLPFDEVKFNPDFFNRNKYIIPKEYFVGEKLTDEIEDKSGEDDTYSTHPNIKKRIENLNKKQENQGVKEYGMSLDFEYILTKSRFETQYLNILQRKFVKTIYECFLLKRKYPNNKFLDECIAKSLYAISKQKTNSNNLTFDSEKEGNLLTLISLFKEKMDKVEINVLALKMMLELSPDTYKPYIEDLVMDLTKKLGLSYDSFYYKENQAKRDSNSNEGDTTGLKTKEVPEFEFLDSLGYTTLTKVGKIKYNRAKQRYYAIMNDTGVINADEQKNDVKSDYFKLAFLEEGGNNDFKQLFEDASKKELKTYFSDLSYMEKSKIRKERDKKSSKFKKVKLDSILILETNYNIYNRKGKLDSKNSYKMNNKFSQSLNELTKKSDVNYLNLLTVDSTSIDEINAKYILKEWKEEMNESYDEKMLSLTQERANEVMNNIGCQNIMITGVNSEYNSIDFMDWGGEKVVKFLSLTITTLSPSIWPLYIYRYNKFDTSKYVLILNKEGYTELYNRFESNKGANYKQDEIFIGNVLNQITK